MEEGINKKTELCAIEKGSSVGFGLAFLLLLLLELASLDSRINSLQSKQIRDGLTPTEEHRLEELISEREAKEAERERRAEEAKRKRDEKFGKD